MMPTTPDDFSLRLAQLKADLTEQGRRVQALLEAAFEAVFDSDARAAEAVIERDDVIDRVDVEIERAAVRLLTEAAACKAQLNQDQLRGVLTIVKVNNELERIADAAVAIAERVSTLGSFDRDVPATFRVMANSVVGILRDVNRSMDRSDAKMAKLVLRNENTVEAFKAEILRDAEQQIARGTMPIDFAFALHEVANQCERMGDHCTNIAEQVIYALTGAVVRHTEGKWVELPNATS